MFSQTQSYFDFFSELEFLNGEKALSINYFPTKFVSPDKLVYSEKLVSQRSVEKRRTVLKNNVNGLIVADLLQKSITVSYLTVLYQTTSLCLNSDAFKAFTEKIAKTQCCLYTLSHE